MDYSNNALQQILDARESRSNRQKELLEKYNSPLVSFTLNIPGPQKSGVLYAKMHEEGLQYFINAMKEKQVYIKHLEVKRSLIGMEAYLSIDLDSRLLKSIATQIEEEHPLGRLFDFDVFDQNGEILNRISLGKEKRKCLLCEEDAVVCGRSRKHPLEDLINKIHQLGETYFHRR